MMTQPLRVPMPLREAALRYARVGWYVFPVHSAQDARCSCGKIACANPAKHPRTANGMLDASRDTAQITAWWGAWPTANIGIATEPSSLAIVDVDAKSGGLDSLESLIQRYGRLDDTMCVLTGGGGQHFLYAAGTHVVASRATAFGSQYPGIDMRGKGGYVIAPPSSHISGGQYLWEQSSPPKPLPLPFWIVELCGVAARAPISGVDEGSLLIVGGERNSQLARYAGRMRRLGTNAEALEAALLAVNAKQCRPPLPTSEVSTIARSIARYAPQEVPQQPIVLTDVVLPVVDVADVPLPDTSDKRRYSVGIENIDRGLRGIRPGEFVVVGARQGQGKTAFAETSALENSRTRHVMFASLEMTLEDIRDRMIGRLMRVDLDEIARLRAANDAEFVQWRDALEGRSLTFYHPTKKSERSLEAILEATRRANSDMLYIDYSRRIEGWQPGKGAADIVDVLSTYAKTERIAIVLLSQLQREAQDRRPSASQLQDTGRLEQDADKLILLYRPFVGDKMQDTVIEIAIAKNRRGPEFRSYCHWVGPYTGLLAMDRDEERAARIKCDTRKKGKSK